MVKDEFSARRAEVLLRVITDSIKLLHPFMPFITEEIYALIREYAGPSESFGSLAVSPWPQKYKFEFTAEEHRLINYLLETVKAVRNIKADLGINTQRVKLELRSTLSHLNFLESNRLWLERLTLAAGLAFKNADTKEELKRVLYDNGLW